MGPANLNTCRLLILRGCDAVRRSQLRTGQIVTAYLRGGAAPARRVSSPLAVATSRRRLHCASVSRVFAAAVVGRIRLSGALLWSPLSDSTCTSSCAIACERSRAPWANQIVLLSSG